MKRITTVFLATGFLFGHLSIAADDASIEPLSSEEKFAILDADQDGFINLQEAKKLKGLPEKFIEADSDKDGKLALSEFALTGLE